MKLDHLVLFASIAAISGAIVYSINSPFPVLRFTEFYSYPNSTSFTYGITNYEGKYMTYGVEGHLIESEAYELLFNETVKLAHKETFTSARYLLEIANEFEGEPSRSGIVVLKLYRKDLPPIQPYRMLHFNVGLVNKDGEV